VSITGARGQTYTATSSAGWLQLTTSSGELGSTLGWKANPAGLSAGNYSGTITVTASGGTTTTLTVRYQVSAPARIGLVTKSLHFSEQAVHAAGQKHIPACGQILWGDELETKGVLYGLSGSGVGDAAASTRHTLVIDNRGASGSKLHYAVDLLHATWLSVDMQPKGPKQVQTKPEQPLVASVGSLGRGARAKLKLASVADTNLVGGTAPMQPGTYRVTIRIRDLADPADVAYVPITLVLGNGRGTPTMALKHAAALSLSLKAGTSKRVRVALTNVGGSCSYAYSLATDVRWARAFGNTVAWGTVPAHGMRNTTVRVSAAGLRPGVHRGTLTVESVDASALSLRAPIKLTVLR
jgi:hypothetical protein